MNALLEFQKDAPSLTRDSTNPHHRSRYLSLETLMQEVLPKLNEHGLVWVTMPAFASDDDGSYQIATLKYELIHVESNFRLEGEIPLPMRKADDPQALGSAITYARRYAMMAVLGLVADEDDDGNAAAATRTPAQHKDDARPAAPVIPTDRAKAILDLAKGIGYAEGEPGAVQLKPVFDAKLKTLVDTGMIGHLNVDAAEDVEAWLREEAKRAAA